MPDIFTTYTIEQIFGTGVALVILAAGIISILFVIWAGFLMIISGGVEEKVKAAVNHIRHAVIGIVLIVAVLFVFPTLLDIVGLPYGDYMRPNAVFSNISSISDEIFGNSTNIPVDSFDSSDSHLPDDFSDF